MPAPRSKMPTSLVRPPREEHDLVGSAKTKGSQAEKKANCYKLRAAKLDKLSKACFVEGAERFFSGSRNGHWDPIYIESNQPQENKQAYQLSNEHLASRLHSVCSVSGMRCSLYLHGETKRSIRSSRFAWARWGDETYCTSICNCQASAKRNAKSRLADASVLRCDEKRATLGLLFDCSPARR